MAPGGLAVAYSMHLNVDTCQQLGKGAKDAVEHPVVEVGEHRIP